jgi:hypothetical protein
MGKLKTGANYVYERVEGIIYQREVGSDPASREEIGWDYDARTEDGRPLIEHIRDKKLWGDIHRAAKKNPLLQDALDRVKIIYELSKDNESKTRD